MAASVSDFLMCAQMASNPQKNSGQSKHFTCTDLSYLCDRLKLYNLPILSALLLIPTASRFLTQDFSLLVPVSFLSSTPLRGMTIPFLFNRNSLRTYSNHSSRHFFFQNNKSAMFSVPHCCLPPPQVSVIHLCVRFILCSQDTHVCRCVCVYASE